jgi:hypothetical protein
MSEFTEDQRVMLSGLARQNVARLDTQIALLMAERQRNVEWLAEHGTSAETCGDCHRPVDAHANFCPQFRWPVGGSR